MFDIDILRIISNNIQPATGKVLISEPLLADNIFSRSVVYLIDDINNSHMGFILNLKSGMYLHDALDGFKDTGIELFLGGPVEPDVIHFIHSFGNIEESQEIGNNLYFGGELDQLREYVNKGIANKTNTKFFLGYSGWTKGQLCEEINNNAWLVAETDNGIVFRDEEKLWVKSLNFVDKRYQIWKNFPINPDLN
jgi:putative transcriptional regulator